ncbi:TonB-dependent siderophore receptor [Novosphingobium sp. P6W]|uniref:TonB-dependent receptor plug domain-containing protein n=1 Tax=Novosphingobium sp. P6W TaxID=1609758 RepID=UPI0006965FA3|nr:TonB-dependent receptor [Novosphingobium sp. P6W]
MNLKTNFAQGVAAIALLAPGLAWANDAPAADAAEADGVNNIVVTGARSAGRTVENSPAPIDVLPAETLRQANQASLLQALNDTLPSFNVPNMPSYGINTFIRAGQLRGLSSGHTLVLINGKRRHVTARLGVNDVGVAAVDLGLIPLSTIDRVEVLRDGASAIYGSDAIAGVINVITRKSSEGGELSARAGQYYQGGGWVQQYNAGAGVGIGDGGHLYVSGQYIDQKALFGDGDVPGNILFYFPRNAAGQQILPGGNASTAPTLPAGATPDPREASVDRHKIFGAAGGVPRAQVASFTADLGVPLGDAIELYGFGDYTHRKGRSPQHFRFPSRDQNVRAIWPDGFTPYSGIVENNFSALLGLRGDIGGGWNWDLSSGYGQDDIDTYVYDSISPSYGLNSKTDFFLGNYRYTAWTSNLDVHKSTEEGLFGFGTDWSLGAEFRRETYRRTAGEEQSWGYGGQPILDGPNAGKPISLSDSGSQADTGVRPEDAASDDRNSYALYAGLSLRPSDAATLDLAARYERYQRAGDVLTGRVSGRYELARGFAVRGTASTGFQAPALAALSFRQTGVTVNQTNHILSVSSPEAQALGARPLKPERSTNFSLGFVVQPLDTVNLSVDVYQVRVKDRISQIGAFRESTHPGSGVLVRAASPTFGPDDSISYLVNAGTTRTRGVDVVLDGKFDVGSGAIGWSLAGNYNKTKFLEIADTPAVLDRFNIVMISTATQAQILYRAPRLKGIGSVKWESGPFSAGLRGTYYGKINRSYTLTHPAGPNTIELVDVGKIFIADLEAGYEFSERLGLRVNVNNLFDTKPRQVPRNATSRWPFSSVAYVQDSPVNPLGGFYSATITYRW